MTNYAPLNITTNAEGAYLWEEQYGDILVDGIRRESAVAQLARVERLNGKREIYSIYAGRPTVDFVDEGAEKAVTGASFSQLTLNVKKLAAIVVYTEELLEDARQDPRVLINQDLAAAFADKIDAHALGYAAGVQIASSFDSELAESSANHELGTGGDAFAVGVSACLADVEGAGYKPSALIAASDLRAHLRDARNTVETASPVYTAGFGREPDSIYGLPIHYSSNLDGFTAASTQKVAVVGDFSNAILGIRKDLTMRVSDQATVNIGGTQHNLWQRNEVAVLWEMRVGFAAHDVNRAFSVVKNAS